MIEEPLDPETPKTEESISENEISQAQVKNPKPISVIAILGIGTLLSTMLTHSITIAEPNKFLSVASDKNIEMYIDLSSIKEAESKIPLFELVSNFKKGTMISDKTAKSFVTGHFLDCEDGKIITTWMEAFSENFGRGERLSQISDMLEIQARNITNENIFSYLCI